MKINEIIVESRSQLDEGVMDTIKSKFSGFYQTARKKIPNFDEVFSVTKSHKSEINDIIKQLIAKKETGKVSKEDIIAAITPLSKKVADEVGGVSGVNEGNLFGAGIGGGIIGGIVGGIVSPGIWFIGSIINFTDNVVSLDISNTFFTSIAVGAAIFAIWMVKKESYAMSPEAKAREKADKEAKELEKGYFADLSLNGTSSAREKDDYKRLYQKYGDKMTNVEIERYSEMYTDSLRSKNPEDKAKWEALKKAEERQKEYFAYLDIYGAKTDKERQDFYMLQGKYGKRYTNKPEKGHMDIVDREKYANLYKNRLTGSPPLSSPPTTPKPSGNGDSAEFDRLTKKLANKEKMTDTERAKFRELYDKGFGQ